MPVTLRSAGISPEHVANIAIMIGAAKLVSTAITMTMVHGKVRQTASTTQYTVVGYLATAITKTNKHTAHTSSPHCGFLLALRLTSSGLLPRSPDHRMRHASRCSCSAPSSSQVRPPLPPPLLLPASLTSAASLSSTLQAVTS